MKSYIKNMISRRCIAMVRREFVLAGRPDTAVGLREAEINGMCPAAQNEHLKSALVKLGLELPNNRDNILSQEIKIIIIELLYFPEPLNIKFSTYLSGKLNHDYTCLANVFSEVQSNTIEKYFIAQKIERLRQLLAYTEFNVAGIAYKMFYSSVAHLSSPFRKITGLTVSGFRKLKYRESYTS